MTPAEVLAAAADKLDALAEAANPGPWFYNSYSAVFSGPMVQTYDEFRPDERHSLERANNGNCEICGEWREPLLYPDGTVHWTWPRGHGCRFFDEDYDNDPAVAHVPSHHGDTAVRRRQGDATYIAAMNPLVGKALAGMLRTFGSEYVRETRHFHEMWNEDARVRMIGDKFPGFTEALALARLIVGGES